MKALLILAAFALTISAAMAQTVAPGTAPGAQTGNPSNMPSAGTPTNDRKMSGDGMDNTASTDRSTKRTMHKGGKAKTNSDGSTMKTKSKM